MVKPRHHRAAERLLKRLDELLLIVCLDVLSAGRFCETSHVDRALPELCLVLFQFADASVLPVVSENIGTSKAVGSPLQIAGLM